MIKLVCDRVCPKVAQWLTVRTYLRHSFRANFMTLIIHRTFNERVTPSECTFLLFNVTDVNKGL